MKNKVTVLKPLSLKKNSLWNTLGSIIYALTQWGVLITIANLGTPRMVGIFTLGLALTAPVALLTRLNQRAAVASDFSDEFDFNEYFSSRIVATGVFLVIMFFISTIFYSSDLHIAFVIISLSLAKAIESVSDILHGQMQKNERLDITAKSKILKGITSLALFAIVFYVSKSLVLATFGFMLTWLVILIVYDFKKTRNFGDIAFVFDKKQQFLILKLTLPLGLAQLISSLNANIPRYFLEHFHGAETLGFFASIIYIITAGTNVIMAISGAVIPRLSKYYQSGNSKKFIKIMLSMFSAILIGGVLATIIVYNFGPQILKLLYTSDYMAYADEFLLFVVIAIVSYNGKFLEAGLTATRKFRIQPFINGIIFVVISILSYLLIPSYGIIGIAFALLTAELLQFIIRGIALGVFLKSNSAKANL